MACPETHPAEMERVLRQYRRWHQLRWPLVAAASGLLVTLTLVWLRHPRLEKISNWGPVAGWWIAGGIATGVAVFALWLWQRRTMVEAASQMDDQLDAKCRLETATALRRDASAIARLQREETAAFLSRTNVPGRLPVLIALAAAVCGLVLAHLLLMAVWISPWNRPAAPAQASSTPAPEAAPVASITWISPEAETKAAPVEEVPLEATAQSTTGMSGLTLEVAVNGQAKMSTPLPMAELGKPGSNKVETSIYLDELEVQPYDMVSYYLHARRIDAGSQPLATSPVQFVEVKPLRDDVREIPNGNGDDGLGYITALKAAQLRLVKENFALAHAEIGKDEPVWQKENTRVGNDQAVLETKADEVIARLTQIGTPAEIVDLLSQARPLMGEAAEKILARANEPALPVQGKSLALITEIEKYFIKTITQNGRGKSANERVSDPFPDRKDLELKQRFQTKSGELELLAAEQERLAADLGRNDATPEASPTPDKNRIEGTLSERQTQISQRVGALLNGRVFAPEVTGRLEEASARARDSLKMLDAGDIPAAREPASAAARALLLALDAMNKAGEEEAEEQLADAMRALNNAAAQAQNAPQQTSSEAAKAQADEAANAAEETRQNLADAAQAQQETGSAAAAERLAGMANALNSKNLQDALQKAQAQARDQGAADAAASKLRALAEEADRQRIPGTLTSDQVARLIEEMKRSRANLERLAALAQGTAHPEAAGAPGRSGTNSEGGRPDEQGEQGEAGKDAAARENAAGSAGQLQAGARFGTSGRVNGPMTAQQDFQAQLVDALDKEYSEAATVLPKSRDLDEVRQAIRQANESGEAPILSLFQHLAGPSANVIALLQAQLERSRRQHWLTDPQLEQAPPAYRAAVADYFEQLSRDYPEASHADPPHP